MRAKDYFIEIAIPNANDYWADKTDIRKAYNVAIAMFSLHEWILHDAVEMAAIQNRFGVFDQDSLLSELRKLINKETDGAFDLLHDIAIGYKHFHVSHAKRVDDKLRKIKVDTFEWEDDQWWSDAEVGDYEQIVIMVTDSEKRGFAAMLRPVTKFYEQHFGAATSN